MKSQPEDRRAFSARSSLPRRFSPPVSFGMQINSRLADGNAAYAVKISLLHFCSIKLRGALEEAIENRVFSIAFH